MYRIKKGSVLTEQQITAYIEKHNAERIHLQKLKDYYLGRQDILNRQMADKYKPNNKIVNPFANYITDTFVGYFMGEPVSYKSTKENEDYLLKIQSIFNYNDEQEENAELAKDSSIYGAAYELLYLDEDTQIRFKPLNPIEIIPIFDDTIEENLEYFIRYYEITTDILNSQKEYRVEVYSKTEIKTYNYTNKVLSPMGVEFHQFKEVPIVIYQNNTEEIGDFENVISLIDSYDKLNSDSINDFEAFVDCYMVLQGMEGTDNEDIAAMKQNRVILLPENAGAEWLIKNQPDVYIENLKNRIAQNIHKFSKVPNMSDENFANNASGVAIRYKLMGLENATSKKERKFKKGLQRRIELITNIFYLFGSSYDWRAIEPVFTRNIPSNAAEVADMLTKIQGLISEETALSLLPFIENPKEEIERKNSEIEVPQYNIFEEEVNE